MATLGFSGQMRATEAEQAAVAARHVTNTSTTLARRIAGLAGVVQDEVVPRLVEAYKPIVNEPDLTEGVLEAPKSGAIDQLADLVVTDGDAAGVFVKKLHEDGMSVEAIYLNVLAPTARLLGKLWETDRRHFADVTVGVGRLQQMLREFEAAFQSETMEWHPAQRALLMPAPHEQHTFGLFMIGEFMRRAGWDAWTGPLPPDRDLQKLVKHGDFSVIGFSASSDSRLKALKDAIANVRRMVGKRPVCIMVGGVAFERCPALVSDVGADGTASDAKSAIKLAHGMLGEQTARP
ncbi:MAG: cobalamin B12-binding domain-containing protein [Pseudomonadota bacterium]